MQDIKQEKKGAANNKENTETAPETHPFQMGSSIFLTFFQRSDMTAGPFVYCNIHPGEPYKLFKDLRRIFPERLSVFFHILIKGFMDDMLICHQNTFALALSFTSREAAKGILVV